MQPYITEIEDMVTGEDDKRVLLHRPFVVWAHSPEHAATVSGLADRVFELATDEEAERWTQWTEEPLRSSDYSFLLVLIGRAHRDTRSRHAKAILNGRDGAKVMSEVKLRRLALLRDKIELLEEEEDERDDD